MFMYVLFYLGEALNSTHSLLDTCA